MSSCRDFFLEQEKLDPFASFSRGPRKRTTDLHRASFSNCGEGGGLHDDSSFSSGEYLDQTATCPEADCFRNGSIVHTDVSHRRAEVPQRYEISSSKLPRAPLSSCSRARFARRERNSGAMKTPTSSRGGPFQRWTQKRAHIKQNSANSIGSRTAVPDVRCLSPRTQFFYVGFDEKYM